MIHHFRKYTLKVYTFALMNMYIFHEKDVFASVTMTSVTLQYIRVYILFYFFFFFVMLGFKLSALCLLGKFSTTELCNSSDSLVFITDLMI
jgi:hypothetical protein